MELRSTGCDGTRCLELAVGGNLFGGIGINLFGLRGKKIGFEIGVPQVLKLLF